MLLTYKALKKTAAGCRRQDVIICVFLMFHLLRFEDTDAHSHAFVSENDLYLNVIGHPNLTFLTAHNSV